MILAVTSARLVGIARLRRHMGDEPAARLLMMLAKLGLRADEVAMLWRDARSRQGRVRSPVCDG
jgi:hypothetical protein